MDVHQVDAPSATSRFSGASQKDLEAALSRALEMFRYESTIQWQSISAYLVAVTLFVAAIAPSVLSAPSPQQSTAPVAVLSLVAGVVSGIWQQVFERLSAYHQIRMQQALEIEAALKESALAEPPKQALYSLLSDASVLNRDSGVLVGGSRVVLSPAARYSGSRAVRNIFFVFTSLFFSTAGYLMVAR